MKRLWNLPKEKPLKKVEYNKDAIRKGETLSALKTDIH